jgi:hypothetical protein
MSSKRIIEKMKKLLAMSESKANEHEAMVAARQLHAMLSKHNISYDQLNEEENPIGSEGIINKCRPWKRIVANNIAKLYFCEFYISRMGSKSNYIFVGSEANRTFAIHIFQMIVKTIEKQSRAESRKVYGKEVPSFVNSFWTGAKDRISERCQQLIIKAKEGTLEDEDGNTLPAMISTYERFQIEIEDWLSENTSLVPYKARTKADNRLGMLKGQEAGDKVQLSRAIQGSNSTKLLTR